MGSTNNTINKPITNNQHLTGDDIDEIHFHTRPRTHKLALRKWLYKNDNGSISKILHYENEAETIPIKNEVEKIPIKK